MKVLIAVDKFKGTLTGAQLTEVLAAGLAASAPKATIVTCPIADGGDGTVAAALAAGFDEITCTVTGPFAGEMVHARYAYSRQSCTAVLEIAEAGGIARLSEDQLDTWRATSFGAGELILHAVELGARTVVVGLGGSASTDGGAGLMQALGVKLQDATGYDLAPGGGALGELASVDLTGLDQRLEGVEIIMASDVTNPLTGPRGAAAVYGPRKGASQEQVPRLNRNLQKLADEVERALNVSRGTFADSPGAGAAGGLGFACLAVLGAAMRPGVDVCFELTGFYDCLDGADLVITGEGKFDEQTLQGKGPAGVAAQAAARNLPVIAVCGVSELLLDQAREAGFTAVYSVVGDTQATLEDSLANPRPYLQELAATIARTHLP